MRAARLLLAAAFALLPVVAQAAPSCPAIGEAQALAGADVAFRGVAQPGPAVNGLLSTPVKFKVTSFLKGSGPAVITVAGGPLTEGIGFVSLPSAGISPHAGEVWIVYAKGNSTGVVETSTCYGTHLAGEPKPFGSESTSPAPSPSTSPLATGNIQEPSSSWAAWAGGGIGAIALIMAIGWVVARTVVGTI